MCDCMRLVVEFFLFSLSLFLSFSVYVIFQVPSLFFFFLFFSLLTFFHVLKWIELGRFEEDFNMNGVIIMN